MEFIIGNRRLKLYPNGVIKSRAIMRGNETKNEKWDIIKFSENGGGYLVCGLTVDGKQKTLRKHRILHLARNPGWDIFDSSPNNCIDHINRSKTDNSVENLRVVTQQQNNFNRSNVKGYSWNKSRNKWEAYIKLDRKKIHISYFENEEDAGAAYLKAKEIYHKFNTELTTDELEEIAEYNASF